MDMLAELDHLADLRDQQTVLDLKRNELRDVVLAPSHSSWPTSTPNWRRPSTPSARRSTMRR